MVVTRASGIPQGFGATLIFWEGGLEAAGLQGARDDGSLANP